MGCLKYGYTRDRSKVAILDRDHATRQPLSQDLFQSLCHGGPGFTRSHDIHLGVTLQIIGYAVDAECVSLAYDRTPYCGNGINCRYPSSKDVSAILVELLDSA
jgi:hypothetical protein